jgi:hypothetical protein
MCLESLQLATWCTSQARCKMTGKAWRYDNYSAFEERLIRKGFRHEFGYSVEYLNWPLWILWLSVTQRG